MTHKLPIDIKELYYLLDVHLLNISHLTPIKFTISFSQQSMHTGLLKHPYLGDAKTYTINHQKVIEIKAEPAVYQKWIESYESYRAYSWKYCLFPDSVIDNEDHQFGGKPGAKGPSIKKIQYNGYFATSLKEQIMTRSKTGRSFSQEESLYVTYTIASAWEQWNDFCDKNKFENNFFAISSEHVLLNSEGDIKLITPLSSPLSLSNVQYLGIFFVKTAPENLPPGKEDSKSWNKSIAFSLGLIGLELISLKTSEPFYYYKNQNLKFNFQEHSKWVDSCSHGFSKPILNLFKLLIDQNPWTRLKLDEFLAILKPYSKSISQCSQKEIVREQSANSLLELLREKKEKK